MLLLVVASAATLVARAANVAAPVMMLPSPVVGQAGVRPARDAEQAFLRHMVDEYEAALALVHAMMMEPAGHAAHNTATDPSMWDAQLDNDKQAMLALLRRLDGEDYSPRAARLKSVPVPTSPRTVGAAAIPEAGAAMPMPGMSDTGRAREHTTAQSGLAAQLRSGIALVDRVAPTLHRRAVREIARRVRATQLTIAQQLAPGERTR